MVKKKKLKLTLKQIKCNLISLGMVWCAGLKSLNRSGDRKIRNQHHPWLHSRFQASLGYLHVLHNRFQASLGYLCPLHSKLQASLGCLRPLHSRFQASLFIPKKIKVYLRLVVLKRLVLGRHRVGSGNPSTWCIHRRASLSRVDPCLCPRRHSSTECCKAFRELHEPVVGVVLSRVLWNQSAPHTSFILKCLVKTRSLHLCSWAQEWNEQFLLVPVSLKLMKFEFLPLSSIWPSPFWVPHGWQKCQIGLRCVSPLDWPNPSWQSR